MEGSMSILLAHHLEPQHLPVLLCLFAAGAYIGWHGVTRWLSGGHGPLAAPADKAPPATP
jgi:hypothetical protein